MLFLGSLSSPCHKLSFDWLDFGCGFKLGKSSRLLISIIHTENEEKIVMHLWSHNFFFFYLWIKGIRLVIKYDKCLDCKVCPNTSIRRYYEFELICQKQELERQLNKSYSVKPWLLFYYLFLGDFFSLFQFHLIFWYL